MAKLDLGLINKPVDGHPLVPRELDRHMVKYVIGQRKLAVERDHSLFQTERWDHSDVFYAVRTHLNQLGYDTSVYNDSVGGGADRRKRLYDMIKPICEDHFHVKRHQIGIYPEDRAVMAFNGEYYAVSFDNLRYLMSNGTDVIVVEKQGTVIKMVPFTSGIGIAFIQSQGFVSEYGTALAQLCDKQSDTAYDYTNYYVPKYRGHLGVLTDCDSSGVLIGLKIKNATRIGIDLDTMWELNSVNQNLGLDVNLIIQDLQEKTRTNTHWDALNGIVNRTGELYEGLSHNEKIVYHDYLTQYNNENGGTIRFIDYLKTNRIELNTILAAAKPTAFWNWLKHKLLELWPDRNYNRVISRPSPNEVYTPTMQGFITRLDNTIRPLIKPKYEKIEDRLNKISGFIKDVPGTEGLIRSSIKKKLQKEEPIMQIDQSLKTLADKLNLVPENEPEK